MPNRDYYLPKRTLVAQDSAALLEKPKIPRSKFMGSWTRKTAFPAGYLIPFMVDEVLPGDHLSYDITAYLRQATLLFPVMDNQRVDTFLFFVPARILWTNWNKFMGEQASPGDSISYLVPTLELNDVAIAVDGFYDHMGIPEPIAAQTHVVNCLPFRAYNKIYNAWFRDENIQNGAVERTGDSGDTANDYVVQQRAKGHDYFTSALPWPQKFTSPYTPLEGMASVTGLGINAATVGGVAGTWIDTKFPAGTNYAQYAAVETGAVPAGVAFGMAQTAAGVPQVFADLATATGMTINAFRQAFMVQTLLERDARGGTRYTEILRSHFGVVSPDYRLQRPEYIGGGSTPLNVTPIAQTAPTAGATLGALGGTGTAAGQHRASYASTEHGYIIGLINVKTEISYQQGIHRMYNRSSRYDFYWPALAGLGEQAILRQEIYATGEATNDNVVFGYQERWHEYRTRYSDVTGIMRSSWAGTLDAWHYAEQFSAAPTLSSAFITDNAASIMTRNLAAGAAAIHQQYIADIMIRRTAVRPIPTFGTPATLGRF